MAKQMSSYAISPIESIRKYFFKFKIDSVKICKLKTPSVKIKLQCGVKKQETKNEARTNKIDTLTSFARRNSGSNSRRLSAQFNNRPPFGTLRNERSE